MMIIDDAAWKIITTVCLNLLKILNYIQNTISLFFSETVTVTRRM